MRRFFGKTSDGIGRTIVRKTEKRECGKSSPWGEDLGEGER